MPRCAHVEIYFVVAIIHLLLYSICPVSSRIYETKDAVVIEARGRYYGNPVPFPMAYAINPYTSPYYQRLNFPSWQYLGYNPASSSVSDAEDGAAISPQSKQKKITCGAGPDSPPARQTPIVSIVGGSSAIPNSWPFIVGLRMFGYNGGNVFCGGSLISPTRVLTAAHCVHKLSAFDISTMTVSLGMHNQSGDANDAQQTRRVTRVVHHKDFYIETMVNDVAILTIDPPVIYSKDISPVCLPPPSTAADQFAGKDAVLMGWGKLKSGGQQPNELQQTTVQIITQAKCNAFWMRPPSPMLNQYICAGAIGKDTCQGDSGGPMVAQTTEGSTSWTQIGVTSFGYKCPADPNKPSVYANVAFFRNWIDRYMEDYF